MMDVFVAAGLFVGFVLTLMGLMGFMMWLGTILGDSP